MLDKRTVNRHVCPSCNGDRRVIWFHGEDEYQVPCDPCNGTGWVSTGMLARLLGDDYRDLREAA